MDASPTLPAAMPASVFRGRGDVRIEEVPVPAPAAGEVLLSVTAAGIWCGSCWQCSRGRGNLCVSYAAVGLHRHGGLARYVATPLANCVFADDYGLSGDDLPEAVRLVAARREGWSDVAPTALALDELVPLGLEPLVEGRAQAVKTLADPWANGSRPAAFTAAAPARGTAPATRGPGREGIPGHGA